MFLPLSLWAQDYQYSLTWLAPNTHTYVVEATVATQTDSYTEFAIPAWRPGRYILQNYAGAVSHVKAQDGDEQPLQVQKVDRNTWRVQHAATVEKVTLRYRYFANNPDAGSSLLEDGQVYFNPVNLFAYVPGRLTGSVRLEVPELPASWKVATALTRTEDHRVFTASSYHEFADCPTVLAAEMKQLQFEDQGTTFFLHFHGNYGGDRKTDEVIIDMARRIAREQAAIFGGYPFETYHFIYRLLPYNLRHAVEHSRSASFVLPAAVTQSPQRALSGIAGITAHEFWHVWNVKRIRPAALWPYDYSQPQYTRLHWFTEGVTDYYTDLTLLRAGLIDLPRYFQEAAGTIQQLENSYAATVVSPSASSFDSWLAGTPYAHPNHRISYYTLGSRLGLMLDFAIRAQSKGKVSLDDVFRYLYKTYYGNGQGVPEDGVQLAVEKLTGAAWQQWFDTYVHGVAPIDYESMLKPMGLQLDIKPVPQVDWRKIGIMSTDDMSQGVLLRNIYPGSDAQVGGLAVNDLVIEVEGENVLKADLETMLGELKPGDLLTFKVIRGVSMKTIQVNYEGRYQPRTFDLSQLPRMNQAQQDMQERWMKSQVSP